MHRDAEKIGRLESDGVITEFDVPTPPNGPAFITMGADGHLWFTERGRIGRLTPQGNFTEFPARRRDERGTGDPADADGDGQRPPTATASATGTPTDTPRPAQLRPTPS